VGEHEHLAARHRKELSGSIFTLLFIFAATYGLDRSFARYLDRLVRSGHFSRWTAILRYLQTGMAIFFLAEMVLVIFLYRIGPLRMTLREMGLNFVASKWKGLLWGFLTGLLVYVASLPLLKFDRHSDLTNLIVNNVFSPRIILVAVLFVILLPISSEIVFRGIFFKSFVASATPVAAVLLSGVFFALLWPVYNPLTGFLLGVTNALLYYRFRNVVVPFVANATLTIAYAVTLVWKQLY